MKRNFFRVLLSAVLLMCCTMMYAEIQPTQPQTDGDGNYELSTAAELYWFANYVNRGNTSAKAILTADITVNESVLDSNGNLASSTFETWTPIGEGADDKAYSGEFNGNGHTISGLYCKDTGKNNIGLFGKANNDAYIHDLGLKDSYFSGNSWVAGICGDFASGRIENCWNAATVISNSNNSDGCCAGGIAASCWTDASVKGCYNIGKVTAQYDTQCGGICGVVNSTVSDCVTLNVCNAVCKDSRNNAQIINVAIKDINAFKSGEVCWLLNGNKIDTKWRQLIGTDAYPISAGNYLVNHSEEKGYFNETQCEKNGVHNLTKEVVKKCNETIFVYWHCTHCDKNFTDADRTKEETDANKSSHFPEYVMGIVPTGTSTGRYGHWHCSQCGKNFLDESCTIEATEENLTVPVATNKEIWYTSTDNNLIENKVNSKTNEYQYGLGKIVLADGVTEIANYAFNRNKTLKSIFIPSAVKKVGDSSFWGCINLNSIFISEGVTFIDQFAFGNTPIQSISIPSTVQTILNGVFDECTQLQSIVFHSLPRMELNSWNISTNFIDLTDSDKPYIGTSLEHYPRGGFTEAKYTLTLAKNSWGTVVLPFEPSSKSISNLEFYSYEGVYDGKVFVLKATDIQAGVPYLVKNVSTDETTSFTLTATNPTITLTAGRTSADGFTFKGCFRSSDIAANSNLYYLDGTAFQKATQDNNVAPLHAYIVAPEVFEKKSMDVVIWNPKTVPVFVDGVLPTTTTTGRYGYWLDESQNKKYWNKLCTKPITDDSELTVPVALNNEIWYTSTDNNLIENKVNSKTNEYHYGLGKIVLADGVTEIADYAFYRNKTLKSIFIPSSVKKVGYSSFFECDAMESVIFSSLPDVDDFAFENYGKLTTETLDLTDSDKPYIGTSLYNYPSDDFTEARFSISLEKNSWETVVLPFVPTNTDGLKFYSCSKVNGMMLEVKETAEIRAGVPYLVKNTSDSKTYFTLTATNQISIVLNTSDPESVNGFTLKGTFQTKDLNKDDSKKYYYWNGVGFCQVTAQQTVNPIHAYIETSDMSAVGLIIPTDQEGRISGILAIDDNCVRLNGSAGSYSLDKLELKYGHSYICTDDFKATSGSYKFRVNSGKWNSWFVPFAVTTGTLEANNLTAAYIAGIRQYEKDAEGNITTQVDIIKIKNARLRAGTPYLVKYDGEDLGDGNILTLDLGETVFAASSDVHLLNSATTTASYDFIGCYEKAEFDISDKDMYYFMGSNGSLVHSKDNSFSALDWYLKVMPKGDVYDDLSTPSLAKSIIINVIGEEDETTGIRTIYPKWQQKRDVYDLMGRKLSATKAGQVNIIGRKKVFINK